MLISLNVDAAQKANPVWMADQRSCKYARSHENNRLEARYSSIAVVNQAR